MKRLLACLLVAACRAVATTWNASSWDDIVVQQASASNGDTITVPAGSYTPAVLITITKNLTIIGTGTDCIVTKTKDIITLGTTSSRLSGFYLKTATDGDANAVTLKGQNFRLDNCKIENTTGTGKGSMYVEGGTGIPQPVGLIDHCTFIDTRIVVLGDIGVNPAIASESWADALGLGTSNCVYMESNTFSISNNTITGNIIDSNYAGRYVVRYNAFTNCCIESHSVQPTGYTDNRASRSWEIYQNTLTETATNKRPYPFWMRGGTGVIYSNAVTLSGGSYTLNQISFDVIRAIVPAPTPSGTHTGSNGATVLTDGVKNYTVNGWTNAHLYNITDGSEGTVASNTATTITGALTGGTRNNWNTGDSYFVSPSGYGNGSNLWDGNDAVTNGTGSHTGSSGASVLTDGTKSWTASAYINAWVYNLTDGSKGKITANSTNTVTAILAGGTDNDWDVGDTYKITIGYPVRDQIGRSTDAYEWTAGTPYPPQALDAAYCWSNTINGSNLPAAVVNGLGAWIQANRDYYDTGTPKPGYSAYEFPNPLGCLTPTIGSASAVSVSAISVPFTAATGDNSTTYTVEQSPDNSSWSVVGTAAATPYLATGLSAATQYYFRVAGGNGTTVTSYSASTNATTGGTITTSSAVTRNPATL